MVEDDAAERVIHAVVNVVAGFAVADGLADDARDGGGGVATRNRPGSARIWMSFGNSRSISALIFRASALNGLTCLL